MPLMEQSSTAQSPQPLMTSLEGQWPPTPVLTAMSWWDEENRTCLVDGTWTGTEPQVVLTCGIYIPYLLFACFVQLMGS